MRRSLLRVIMTESTESTSDCFLLTSLLSSPSDDPPTDTFICLSYIHEWSLQYEAQYGHAQQDLLFGSICYMIYIIIVTK